MEDPPTTDFDLIPQYMYIGGRVKYDSNFSFTLSSMGGAQNLKNPQTLNVYSTKTIAHKIMRFCILRVDNKLCSVIALTSYLILHKRVIQKLKMFNGLLQSVTKGVRT